MEHFNRNFISKIEFVSARFYLFRNSNLKIAEYFSFFVALVWRRVDWYWPFGALVSPYTEPARNSWRHSGQPVRHRQVRIESDFPFEIVELATVLTFVDVIARHTFRILQSWKTLGQIFRNYSWGGYWGRWSYMFGMNPNDKNKTVDQYITLVILLLIIYQRHNFYEQINVIVIHLPINSTENCYSHLPLTTTHKSSVTLI